MASKPLHVSMLPWSAFGHLIPFFQLSVALAKSGVCVSYVSTPRNIERLPPIPPALSKLFTFVELQMPKVDELPEGAEATVDLPLDQIQYLKLAYELLEEPFSQVIASHSPDWVITDFASYWAPKLAKIHGVPHMLFSIFGAAFFCFVGPKEYLIGEGRVHVRPNPASLMRKPKWVQFESSVFFREQEAIGFHAEVFIPNASGVSDAERLAKVLEGCQAVTIRSCREFEGEYLDAYEKCIERRVVPAGSLPLDGQLSGEIGDGKWSEVFKWLDEHSNQSVVFVGFGSEYKLTKKDVNEIAYGLEMSNMPFLWALRRPSWAADDSDALPEGLSCRASGKGSSFGFSNGMVCFGWVPQQKILAHPSIGSCFIHCGWGSVTESLQHGHILVVLPFIIDQGLNARLLVEKGLAVEDARREDESFSRDEVARSLRKAMVESEGENIRACAKNVAKVFGDEKLQQECYIGGLVEYLTRWY